MAYRMLENQLFLSALPYFTQHGLLVKLLSCSEEELKALFEIIASSPFYLEAENSFLKKFKTFGIYKRDSLAHLIYENHDSFVNLLESMLVILF